MASNIDRRTWLRKTGLLTGGMAFLPAIFNSVDAAYVPPYKATPFLDDRQFGFEFEEALPELKARLFANENPFGPSEAAKKALIGAVNESCRYAMKRGEDLQKKLSEYEGLTAENIMLGAGSSPLLRAASIYFSKPGGNIVTADPTYDDLPEHAEGFKSQIIKVPLTKDFHYDLDAMEKAINANTALVYICNPNNPTGTTLDGDKLRAFCERVSAKVPVFVDEAYIDYVKDTKATSVVECIKKGHNVIVARTFSKLYGFAGLRVGYILSQPDILKGMEPYTCGPWSISAPAMAAADATFKEMPYTQEIVTKTMASKNYLYDVLKQEGYTYIPSDTNFVMFPIQMEGKKFVEELFKRGVGTRFWKFNDANWCRISIGRMDEMQAFASAFKEIS